MKLDHLCEGLDVADDKQALEVFRCIRWANGVFCPKCKSFDIVMAGGGTKGKVNRYICKLCKTNFNDFTGTIFHKSKLPVGEICYILLNLKNKSVKQLSEELYCSRQSIHRMSKIFNEEVNNQAKNKRKDS